MINIRMPRHIEDMISRIEAAGHEAYAVGGCIRDTLAGRTDLYDWDMCSSAEPSQVMEIFSDTKVIPTGIKHGTVTVMMGDEPVELTTFRAESEYSDSRHPDSVVFVKNIEEDLARRDFTVNAMAYAPSKGLVDPFGGQQDLAAGILRCVGDPVKRFEEDALRVLRGLRFMSQKGLKAEPETDKAIRSEYWRLGNIAQERITSEFIKLMCGDFAADIIDAYREVFCFLIPELEVEIGYDQHSPYHNRTVWDHTICAVRNIPAEPDFRIAMLFHDIAKPVVGVLDDNGRGRFVGHPAKGAEIADEILRRMKFPNDLREKIVELVRYHDAKIQPDRVSVRKWLSRLGTELYFRLMHVRYADSTGKYERYIEEAVHKNEALREIAETVISEGDCFTKDALAVSGNDIRDAGFTGRDIGDALDWLLDEVIEGRLANDRETLLAGLKKKES